MTDNTLVLVLILWIVCAIGCYAVAANRGLPNPGNYGVFGLVLGPFGFLLAGFATPPSKDRLDRVCVHCGKTVAPDRDRFCDHCGEPFAA